MVSESFPSPLGVKLMRASGGNSKLLAPAPEQVVWGVSLLLWSGLLLGKCTLPNLSTGLEDMQGVRKVSPM